MKEGWTEGSGGAIAVRNAALTLHNSVISGSGARELGGGIYALDSALTLIGQRCERQRDRHNRPAGIAATGG